VRQRTERRKRKNESKQERKKRKNGGFEMNYEIELRWTQDRTARKTEWKIKSACQTKDVMEKKGNTERNKGTGTQMEKKDHCNYIEYME
jgi:hypothetical protein